MTNLAIIGGGILGRSLIYTLAKEQKSIHKITLFDSPAFAPPCSLNSTAIVAPRGLSVGHSPLGDLLVESFSDFSAHVSQDSPRGVQKIKQFTADTKNISEFKKRYPNGEVIRSYFKEDKYVAEDTAYLIDPLTYTDWLLEEFLNKKQVDFEWVNDFVLEVSHGPAIRIKTLSGREEYFDKVIFAGGSYNRFWNQLAGDSKLKLSRPSQGSYFEFNHVPWSEESFSLTYNGDNLVWNAHLKRLLIGSTTLECGHCLAPMDELDRIYNRLQSDLELNLPIGGMVKVGLREKAPKRSPYLIQKQGCFYIGGLYKNGFTLALKMSKDLTRLLV